MTDPLVWGGPPPSTESWTPVNNDLSGGVSVTGIATVVGNASGYWRARMMYHLLDDDDVLWVAGLMAELEGQVGTILMGPADLRGCPWAKDMDGRVLDPSFVRRGELGSSAWDWKDPAGPVKALVWGEVAADAGYRSRVVRIRMKRGGAPKWGTLIGIGQRVYRIGLSQKVSAEINDYDCKIWPGLRSAATAGTLINFTSPVTKMRLAPDAKPDPTVAAHGDDMITFDFIEDLRPD